MANTQNLDLVKPIGTDHALISDLNGNSDKIDAYAGKVNTGLDGLRDGIAILADGNTHAAITSGQFVYVKNHQTLPEGLYQASANIAANAALSTSNLTADAKGGLNSLSEQIGTLNSKIRTKNITLSSQSGVTINSLAAKRSGNIVSFSITANATYTVDSYTTIATIEFPPPISTWVPAFNSNTGLICGMCRIDTNGLIRVLPSASVTEVKIHACYVVDND